VADKQDNKKKPKKDKRVIGFVGVGLDNEDGEYRLTKSEHFFLIGGSEETHEHMQDTAIRFDEALKKRGKTLPETSLQEIIDLFDQARG
jgi:hypothetical protein